MSASSHVSLTLITLTLLSIPSVAADSDRDFSGKWTLDASASRPGNLDIPAALTFSVVQQDNAIHLSTNASYNLDGNETRYKINGETYSVAVKWEGGALLINALVSGRGDYTVMDRWKLSRDRLTLTVNRQVMRGTFQSEGVFIYRAEGWAPAPRLETTQEFAPPTFSQRSSPAPAAAFRDPSARNGATVPAGTRIPLALRNSVDTRHSREGDRIYLETIYPVSIDGHIVIPPGSFVNGTITLSKAAGRGARSGSKGEMFIRFDSLTLPSGATRDFRSHIAAAEGKQVDRDEGKVTGERDTGRDAAQVATVTGMGASIGGLAASGHALKGVGIGAGVGAAAGLASVLLKRGPEATLHKGTTVEMVLDRDLEFTANELRW